MSWAISSARYSIASSHTWQARSDRVNSAPSNLGVRLRVPPPPPSASLSVAKVHVAVLWPDARSLMTSERTSSGLFAAPGSWGAWVHLHPPRILHDLGAGVGGPDQGGAAAFMFLNFLGGEGSPQPAASQTKNIWLYASRVETGFCSNVQQALRITKHAICSHASLAHNLSLDRFTNLKKCLDMVFVLKGFRGKPWGPVGRTFIIFGSSSEGEWLHISCERSGMRLYVGTPGGELAANSGEVSIGVSRLGGHSHTRVGPPHPRNLGGGGGVLTLPPLDLGVGVGVHPPHPRILGWGYRLLNKDVLETVSPSTMGVYVKNNIRIHCCGLG